MNGFKRYRGPAGRRARTVAILAGGLVAAALVAGCGGRGGALAPGCYGGDRVPAAVRNAVAQASRDFYARARRGEWHAVYENAAADARKGATEDRFTAPMARLASSRGIPADLKIESLRVVKFGEGFPHTSHVTCSAPGEADPTTLILPDHPLQASLVQTGELGGERFYYATLWFQEDGAWKLAAFFTKPATVDGKSWEDYRKEAADQRLASHLRNAALLYNVAIDLSVPAAWVKPGAVSALQRDQRRISVEGLPSGKIIPWIAPPDTFLVRTVGYTIQPSGLGLIVQYQARSAIADSSAQAAYADRMFAYMRKQFPEYPEVFHAVTFLAYDPKHQQETWSRTRPLGASR